MSARMCQWHIGRKPASYSDHVLRDGFVMRHDPAEVETGLAHGEGAFLACSFWLADALLLSRKETKRASGYLTGCSHSGTM